jgi:hypothetical protein
MFLPLSVRVWMGRQGASMSLLVSFAPMIG